MTWEGITVLSTRLTHAFAGHIERQMHAIAGCNWRIRIEDKDTWNGSQGSKIGCLKCATWRIYALGT